jgi:hypothetical protein
VTRNCDPESGKSDTCEYDVHGNKICHCQTDFCNQASNIKMATLGMVVLAVLGANLIV